MSTRRLHRQLVEIDSFEWGIIGFFAGFMGMLLTIARGAPLDPLQWHLSNANTEWAQIAILLLGWPVILGTSFLAVLGVPLILRLCMLSLIILSPTPRRGVSDVRP